MTAGLSYQDALDYLSRFINYEKGQSPPYNPEHFSPSTFDAFLQTLGAPHEAFPSVHIAGSKGKGSTAAMIASILTQTGLRTGLVTSPHLVTIRERTQIDRQLISPEAFAGLVTELQPHVDGSGRNQTARARTFFEVTTALSFLYFARQSVDIAVVEVGLGGRLDTTNVLTPEVSVITPIGFEHTKILGDTLAEIAGEKAGIIKPHGVVISAAQAPEVIDVLERRCQDQEATLHLAGRDFSWHVSKASDQGAVIHVEGFGQTLTNLRVPLIGQHQAANAAVAVAIALQLQHQNWPISTPAIQQGLEQVEWEGRLEMFSHHPRVILDAGHTIESAQSLRQALTDLFEYSRLHLVLGVSADKNIPAIIDILAPLADAVIVTPFNSPRSCSPEQLAAEISRHHVPVHQASNPISALAQARHQANDTDLICVTGSLFLLGELKAHQQGLPQEF